MLYDPAKDDQTVNDLRAIKDHLSDPSRWCKNNYFQNEKGEPCERAEATKTCLVGATFFTGLKQDRHSIAMKFVADAISMYPKHHISKPHLGYVPSFNDSDGIDHSDIMAVLDTAIEKASEKARQLVLV
jgi:hypothetical protein